MTFKEITAIQPSEYCSKLRGDFQVTISEVTLEVFKMSSKTKFIAISLD